MAAAGLFCISAAGLTPAVASTRALTPSNASRPGQPVQATTVSVHSHAVLHGSAFKNRPYFESPVAMSPYWLAAENTDASAWDAPPPAEPAVVATAVAPPVVVDAAPAPLAAVRPTAAPSARAASRPGSGSASLSGGWACIAAHESGGNPHAVSAGGYYGMFQFSLSTWHSVGGSGNPANASAQEQLTRAQMLQARSGWGQWSTAASCGL
jgi:Transglycosylase-like domain